MTQNSPKRSAVFALLVLCGILFFQSGEAFNFPAKSVIKEKFFSIGNDFEIYAEGEKDYRGKIVQRILNLTTTFELLDEKGELVAKARSKFWALGSTIEVTDAEGKKIGTIKENVLKSLFKVTTSYRVLDAQDKEIGISKKLDLLSTDIVVYDLAGKQLFQTKRPWLNLLTDKWTTTLDSKSTIDPRILVFIPAYKTAVDNYRRANSSEDYSH